MSVQYFDTHSHIDLITKDLKSQEDLIQLYKKNDISKVINVSIDLNYYWNSKKISNKYKDFIYSTAGVHPLANFTKNSYKVLQSLLKHEHENIVAIGECGLDYYKKSDNSVEDQKEMFLYHIYLSKEYHKPLIIHCRDAFDDVYNMLLDEKPSCPGIIHCYSGDEYFMNKFVDLGFYISYAGNLTYTNSYKIQDSCKITPVERLLIETDAPFLVPYPLDSKIPNNSINLKYILDKIASIKDMDKNLLSKTIFNNSKQVFNLLN